LGRLAEFAVALLLVDFAFVELLERALPVRVGPCLDERGSEPVAADERELGFVRPEFGQGVELTRRLDRVD
jgi:hypothetical protein